jgi:hypothetical protein
MGFRNLQKTLDTVAREILWWTLLIRGASTKFVGVKEMYTYVKLGAK